MAAADADSGRGRITYTKDLGEALQGADFVLETVPEQKELKQQVFQDIESKVGDDVILLPLGSGEN